MVGVSVFPGGFTHIFSLEKWGVAGGAVCVGVGVDVAVVVVVAVSGEVCGVVEFDGFVAVWAVGLECFAETFAVVDVSAGFVYGAGLGVCDGLVAVRAGVFAFTIDWHRVFV